MDQIGKKCELLQLADVVQTVFDFLVLDEFLDGGSEAETKRWSNHLLHHLQCVGTVHGPHFSAHLFDIVKADLVTNQDLINIVNIPVVTQRIQAYSAFCWTL